MLTAYCMQYTLQRIQRMSKWTPQKIDKILLLPSFNASEGAGNEGHRHIAPWFWKYTKIYTVAQPNHHHPRIWKMKFERKNTSLYSSNSQRLGRCWKWNYNGQLDIEFIQKCTMQLIQSTTISGYEKWNAGEKNVSASQPSTPRNMFEIENYECNRIRER